MSIHGKMVRRVLSSRTVRAVQFDWLRYKTRRRTKRFNGDMAAFQGLHLGCGPRRVDGWLNVDLVDSDIDVDLGNGYLPFDDGTVHEIVSQHLIEHLEMTNELLPLLKECRRVLVPGGRIWLSCPDLEKVCRGYVEDRCAGLIRGRQLRHSDGGAVKWNLDKETRLSGTPSSQMVNSVFYQDDEHRNLFDFTLLDWLLRNAGFSTVRRICERALLEAHPEFPPRNDDEQSIYVVAQNSGP